MRLVTTTQAIIPWEIRVPLTFPLAYLHDHHALTIPRQALLRKPIATLWTLLGTACARVDPDLWRLMTMLRVPRYPVHQGCHETLHKLHIHAPITEHSVEHHAQI